MEAAAYAALAFLSALIAGAGLVMVILKRIRHTETQSRIKPPVWSDPHNPSGY